jgi:cell division cycle 14
MRLMRPGSCVGPQQHYLYENQMTWVRWAAVDAVKAEQRASHLAQQELLRSTTPPLQTPRPITPPDEAELTRSRQNTPGPVPRTPGRPVAVPGQPRKTPGKSKHSVASPEVQHGAVAPVEEIEGEEGMEVREELMLVHEEEELKTTTTTAKTKTTTTAIVPAAAPKRAPTPTSTRPTRIARARQRPLSAIMDNQIVDRLGLNPGSGRGSSSASSSGGGARGAEEFRRSKAVKDLGTLFESATDDDSSATTTTTVVGRYSLRGGRTSPSNGDHLAPAAPIVPPSSPSKLPQRIPAKRRGATKEREMVVGGGPMAPSSSSRRERSNTAGGGAASCAMDGGIGVTTAASVGLSRSVRRRRSSLGSTDFVQT